MDNVPSCASASDPNKMIQSQRDAGTLFEEPLHFAEPSLQVKRGCDGESIAAISKRSCICNS